MTAGRVTIADVARQAGLTKGAVSRALSGQTGVSETTRERVRQIAAELGWRPNATAQSLSRSRAGAIGWVIQRTPKSSTVDPFFVQMFIGMQMGLSSSPINLVVRMVETLEAELQVHADWATERRVDAVILNDLRVDDPRVVSLNDLKVPVLAVAPADRIEGLSGLVSAHDPFGVDLIMEHLYAVGSRHIGWVLGPEDFVATQTRIARLDRWSSTSHGAPVLIRHASLAEEDIGRQAARMAELGCDAIVVDNELGAMAAERKLKDRGHVVGRETALVSWLDSDLCQLAAVPVTALRHDTVTLGTRLVEATIATLAGEREPALAAGEPTLIARESTSRSSAAD